jgi:hypothetical protein
VTGLEHFAATAQQPAAQPKPKEHHMTTNQQATTEPFPIDTEVTITITGKVVGGSGQAGRLLVVEYLRANGFPDRFCVDIHADSVTAVNAPPATDEEQARRDNVHALIREACRDC